MLLAHLYFYAKPRIAANLGACALQLDDPQTASTELRTALSLKPNHHHALSYASLAAMVIDERDEALDYSERSCPPEENDPDIIANRIRVLHWAGKAEEIEQLLRDKPWVAEDKACSFVLGLARLNDGDYAGAEANLRTSLCAKEDNPYAHRLLAEAIIIPLDDEMLKDAPLPWRAPGVRERVEEVERELTRSAELFEKFDNRARLHEALVQRAYVRGLLGRFEDAVEDCDRILADDRKNGEALRFKGQLLMLAGETDQAIKVFGKIEDKDERRKAALAIAHAFSKKGQADEVIGTISEYWHPGERERRQLVIADLLLEAHHRKGDAEAVGTILRSLEETWHDEPDALMVRARQRRREGQAGEAADDMRRVLRSAQGNDHNQLLLRLD
jgi:tetratricopeptide (TPR) repeat protein